MFHLKTLTCAALTLSFVVSTADAANLPPKITKAPASQDGMQIKMVSARSYGKATGRKLGKTTKVAKRASVKVAAARITKKKAEKIALRGADKPVTMPANPKPVSQTIAKLESPHTTPVERGTVDPKQVEEQRLADNKESKPVADKDLVDTLDRLPITDATNSKQRPEGMLKTTVATPAAAAPSDYSFVLQMKNRLTTGRKYELEEIGGKNFQRKHELIVGVKHSSGWGTNLTQAVTVASFDDNTKDKTTTGDLTQVFYHPAWYKGTNLEVTGFARLYYPTSENAKKNNQWHYFYYLEEAYDFGGGFKMTHATTPHYYDKQSFGDDDTFFLLEEELMAKYAITPSITIAAGPYAQVDCHERAAPGTSIELTPFVGFTISPNVYFESKMFMPLYTDGQVGGGPRRVALSEIAGEFYLKLTL